MKPISLQQVRQVVAARALTPPPSAAAEITSISTDTRTLRPGALFVALKAERDGHDFLPHAASAGALAALVEHTPADRLPNLHLLQVPGTRQSLGRLARHVRRHLPATVIAVGGSNGKTGTKHLIDSALRPDLRGSFSPKSFNNDIGVPLAIFAAEPAHQYLVLELGTNRHGEISSLTEMAQPDIAIITNCHAEHLEGLDDIAGVRREEASIIQGLDPKGLLIVNGDDPDLLQAVSLYPGKRITFGFGSHNDLHAADIRCDAGGTRFRLNRRREIFIPLLGRHAACNALAAIAAARRLGLSEDRIVENLAHAHAPEMRLQLQELHGITLLNDAYNANPASMQAAIDTLCAIPTAGRRIAILGDMCELGSASEQLHRQIGQFLAGHHSHNINALVCVGDQAQIIADSALASGYPATHITHFPDAAMAAGVDAVPRSLLPGDLVLLKGSRSMRLETIGQAIGTVACKGAFATAPECSPAASSQLEASAP